MLMEERIHYQVCQRGRHDYRGKKQDETHPQRWSFARLVILSALSHSSSVTARI
jgi:hypothetical protein